MNHSPSSLKIQELAYELKIEDAMSAGVITVSPESTMADVREILKQQRISGLPVMEDNRPVGMISMENLIKCILAGGIENLAKDNMTKKFESVYAHEPLILAIRKFEKLRYGRFPVLDQKAGKLAGILTKGDIIKCLLKKLEKDYHREELQRYRASHIFEDLRSDETTILLNYNIKGGDHEVAGEQSGYLKTSLLRLGIHPVVTRRVTIAACEAEMNIIIYTEGGQLVASVGKDVIKVNSVDHGPGIADIEKAMQPGYSTAPDWVREMGFGAGMGLPNIKDCTDRMKIDSELGKGTNLEFVVNVAR